MPNLYHGTDEAGDWVKITSYKGYFYYNYLDDDDKKLIDMDLTQYSATNFVTALLMDSLVLRQNQLITYMKTGVPPPPKNSDKSIWDDIADGFSDLENAIANGVEDAANTVKNGVEDAANKVKDVGETAFDKVKDFGKDLLKKIFGKKGPDDDDTDYSMYIIYGGIGLSVILLIILLKKLLF